MRATQTLQWKLSLLAAGYAGSLCANLVLSSICILAYFQPMYRAGWRDLQSQQRVERVRALLRRESWAAWNPTAERSGPELAELEASIRAESEVLGQALTGERAEEAWITLRPALHGRNPREGTQSVVQERYGQLDRLLADLSTTLGRQRYDHLARAARIQHWVVIIMLASTVLGASLCAIGLLLVRRWVVAPVLELRRATSEIGRGNFEHRVVSPHPDELGRLGEEINQMSARLFDLQTRLLEQERLSAASETLGLLQDKLRDPLAEIRVLAGSILDEFSQDREVADCQQRIVATVDRFESWLNLLRDSLAPQSIRPELVPAGELLEDVVNALRPLLDRSGVDVRVRVDPDLRIVRVDRLHFSQVVLALVTNAVEASHAGQMVRVEATAEAGPADTWRLSVLDSGAGVPPDLRERIFQPFFTTKVQGNGIGLAMAHKVVRLHGGELTVESAPGQGSRFTATFEQAPGGLETAEDGYSTSS